MGKNEIEHFLTYLATKLNVSPTTQNQAFNAILFLYEQVLNISLKDQNIQALRAKERKHIPVVLTIEEVRSIILNITGVYQLVVKLLCTPRAFSPSSSQGIWLWIKSEIRSPLDF